MFHSKPARPLAVVSLLLTITGTTPAHAQEFTYKCQAANGRWLYSDRPCEGQGARQTNREAEEPAQAPLAPPSVEQLAARARELTVRPQAIAAAQAAVDTPAPKSPARRPHAGARPAGNPAAMVNVAPAPDMQEIDPDGLLRQPLVKYRSPVLDALSH